MVTNLQPLVGVAIQILPDIIAMLRTKAATADPSAPAVDDATALAALMSAVASSVAKDDRWLAAHPK
jgi:hypothetical protein